MLGLWSILSSAGFSFLLALPSLLLARPLTLKSLDLPKGSDYMSQHRYGMLRQASHLILRMDEGPGWMGLSAQSNGMRMGAGTK